MMRRGGILVLLLAVLCAVVEWGGANGIASITEEDPLSYWLRELRFEVPRQEETVDGIHLTIGALICGEIEVEDLRSQPKVGDAGVLLSATGLGGKCNGPVSYKAGFVGGTVEVTAQVTGAKLSGELQLKRVEGKLLPNATNLESCSLNIQPSDVSLSFAGGATADILNLLKGYIDSYIATEVSNVTCQGLRHLTDDNLSRLLRQVDKRLKPLLDAGAIPPSLLSPGGDKPNNETLDLWHNPIVGALNVAARHASEATGNFSLEWFVGVLTNGTGILAIPSDMLPSLLTVEIPNGGNITALTNSLEVTDLDGGLSFFGPDVSSWNMLNARVGLGQVGVKANLTITVAPHGSGINGVSLIENVIVSTTVDDVTVSASTLLELERDVLSSMRFGDIIQPCAMQSVLRVGFPSLELNSTPSRLHLTPLSGGPLEGQLDEAINAALETIMEDYLVTISDLIKGVTATSVRSYLNGTLNEKVHDWSSEPCTTDAFNDGLAPNYGKLPTVALICASILLGLGFVWFTIAFIIETVYIARRTSHGEEDFGYNMLMPSVPMSEDQIGDGDASEVRVGAQDLSLAFGLPLSISVSLPLLIFGTILLFVAANLNIGAEVLMAISADVPWGSNHITLPPLFQFTLLNSISDMWQAKVYALAILVALFSGIWPYVKLLLLAFAWFVSPRYFGIGHRKRLLVTVDALGKWSLIDTFVLILFMVAFRMSLVAQQVDLGSGTLDMYVAPRIGFFLFFAATILSFVIGHVALAMHRRVTRTAFGMAEGAPGNDLSGPRGFSLVGLIIMGLSTFAVTAAFFVPSFKFTFKGLLGFLLGNNASRTYSVGTLATSTFSMTWPGQTTWERTGVVSIAAALVLFTLVTVLAHHVLLTHIWLKGWFGRHAVRMLRIAEVLSSWASLDVFAVSIFAALLQIEQFAKFIVGNKCDGINKFIHKDFPFVDGDCFDVVAHLTGGASCLIVGVCCSFILGQGGLYIAERRYRPGLGLF